VVVVRVGVVEAPAPGPGAAVAEPPRHSVQLPSWRRVPGRAAQQGEHATARPGRRAAAAGDACASPVHEGARYVYVALLHFFLLRVLQYFASLVDCENLISSFKRSRLSSPCWS
jgi:hypothetical protein